MEFGIAAGQIDCICMFIRRLVGQRREETDVGALAAPVVDQVRIGKCKGVVPGNGDPLTQWFKTMFLFCRCKGGGCIQQRIEVDVFRCKSGRAGNKRLQIRPFVRLDQPQMP